MKQAPYMANTELQQLMWLSAFEQALENILADKSTVDKEWRKWLKLAGTYTAKVIDARVEALDKLEQVKLERRVKKLGIKVYSYDDARVDKDDQGRTFAISQEDFLELVAAVALHCYACPQGEVVKECPRRKLFHRLGLSCHAYRENPAPGECEFRYENEQRLITPQFVELKEKLIEQLP